MPTVPQAELLRASQAPESMGSIEIENGLKGGQITVTMDQLDAIIERRLQRNNEERVETYDPFPYLKEAMNKDQTLVPYQEPHPTKKGQFIVRQFLASQHQYPRMVYRADNPLTVPVLGEPGRFIPNKQRVVHNDRELKAALDEGYSLDAVPEDELSRARRIAGEAEEAGRAARARVEFIEGTEPDAQDPDNVEARLCLHCHNRGHAKKFCPVAIEEAAQKRKKAA